jgi:hypothetical protein
MTLSTKQIETLLRPIDAGRVASTNEGMSHLQVWDVRRWLIRVFGHAGFSIDVIDLEQIYEQSKIESEQPRWRAAYRATVRLTIHNPDTLKPDATYTEAAVGTNFGWLPDTKRDEAHDMAIKTAVSQATKRCAVNLGDQFGLSLYAGTTNAVVKNTLPYAEAMPAVEPPTAPADDHQDEPVSATEHDPTVEPETAETAETPATPADTTATPDPTEPAGDATPEAVEDLATRLVEAAGLEKAERTPVVTRLGIEASKTKVQSRMTSRGVTIATLIDRAFAGEVTDAE